MGGGGGGGGRRRAEIREIERLKKRAIGPLLTSFMFSTFVIARERGERGGGGGGTGRKRAERLRD